MNNLSTIRAFLTFLLTKENITFAIAVFGFILSIYNFVHEKNQNKMKLQVIYKNHFITAHDSQGITLSLSFENLVANPISISRIYLCINNEKYDFYWTPQFVFRNTQQCNGEVLDEINVHTIPLPFKIEGYGVVGGFFFTKASHNITNEQLLASKTSLIVHSNKGKNTYEIVMDNASHEN